VVCSILGIAANFALGGKVPEIIDGFLAALGNTFSALALFILGVNMQGKLALFGDRRKLSVPLLLILGKSLALPVIIRLLTQALGIPGEDPITVAAFLIGTFPTAPSGQSHIDTRGREEGMLWLRETMRNSDAFNSLHARSIVADFCCSAFCLTVCCTAPAVPPPAFPTALRPLQRISSPWTRTRTRRS